MKAFREIKQYRIVMLKKVWLNVVTKAEHVYILERKRQRGRREGWREEGREKKEGEGRKDG